MMVVGCKSIDKAKWQWNKWRAKR